MSKPVSVDLFASTDQELLRAFLDQDHSAFECLLERHVRMVTRVLRRYVVNRQELEDAQQSVFLVLATRAWSLRTNSNLESWLFGVARRVGTQIQVKRNTRERHERQYEQGLKSGRREGEYDVCEGELNLIDALDGLPVQMRTPLLMHYLSGCTIVEIAQRLGCKPSTISMRISRGREKLREHFARRGVVLSMAGTVSLLSQDTWAKAPSSTFVQSCSQAAIALAKSGSCAGLVGTQVQTLTKGVLQMIFLKKLKVVAAACLALSAVLGGIAIGMPTSSGQVEADSSSDMQAIVNAYIQKYKVEGDTVSIKRRDGKTNITLYALDANGYITRYIYIKVYGPGNWDGQSGFGVAVVQYLPQFIILEPFHVINPI